MLIFLLFQEEEQGKSDSSENHDENPVIESKADANNSPESGKTQNGTETPGCVERSENKKEENLVTMNKKEDVEQKVCREFYTSVFSHGGAKLLFVFCKCTRELIAVCANK